MIVNPESAFLIENNVERYESYIQEVLDKTFPNKIK